MPGTDQDSNARSFDGAATRQGFATSQPRCGAVDRSSRDRTLEGEDSVGRYELVGGLDAVGPRQRFVAFDTELHRKATLTWVDGESSPAAAAALLAGARRQGRVCHPHVIAVYEFGERAGRVFVAVERPDGVALDQWLAGGRSLEAMAVVFRQIAEALASVHAIGLVHGGLDAAAVVIDDDGSARVGEFGSRVDGDTSGASGVRTAEDDCRHFRDLLHVALGQAHAARSSRDRALRTDLMRVATGVDAAVSPDMSRVAAALSRAIARRQSSRRGMAWLALAAVATAVAALPTWWAAPGESCASPSETAAQSWASHRATVQQAFVATRLTFADEAWRTLDMALSSRAERIAALEYQACREADDVVRACAQRAHRRLSALANSLRDADALTVRNVDAVLDGFDDLDVCAKTSNPPVEQVDPDHRVWADELAALRFIMLSGHVQRALELVETVAQRATTSSDSSLAAETWLLMGQIQRRAWRGIEADLSLGKAVTQAMRTGDVTTMATAWSERLRVGAEVSHRLDAASRAADHAEALMARLDHDHRLRLELDENRGRLLYQTEDYATALPLLEDVLARRRALDDDPVVHQVPVLEALGDVHWGRGSYDRATAYYEEALALARRELGDGHPMVADRLGDLAWMRYEASRYDDSLALYREAMTILEATGEHEGLDAAGLHNNTASVYIDSGDYDRARYHLEQAVALFERLEGIDHFDVAIGVANIGDVDAFQGRHHDALRRYDRALRIFEKTIGRDGHDYLRVQLGRGTSRIAIGDVAAGITDLEQVVAGRKAGFGPDHPRVADAFIALARARAGEGEFDESARLAAQAVSIREGLSSPDPGLVADAMWQQAIAERQAGRPTKAEVLLRRAIAAVDGVKTSDALRAKLTRALDELAPTNVAGARD